jgi:glycosyltransferase involved in cell wall biosynthesis
MRIAIVNRSSRKVGSAGAYLHAAIPALDHLGHDLAMFCEADVPANRSRIALPTSSPLFCVETAGPCRALAQLTEWGPQVLYVHGLTSSAIESRLLRIAPVVIFVHEYSETSISRERAVRLLHNRPSTPGFHWQRRCLSLGYQAILTASEYARVELMRCGFPSEMLYTVESPMVSRECPLQCGAEFDSQSFSPLMQFGAAGQSRLLFMGHMSDLKGGSSLLAALPRIADALGHRVEVIFVGNGPARASWEAQARRVESRNPSIAIGFVGWLNRQDLEAAIDACHLLVMPSLWPEPSGPIAPEAGVYAVPAVAYAVGGAHEWLIDGVNGHLAPGNPPSVRGLIDAVVKCLCDPDHYQYLQRGAHDRALELSLKVHLAQLIEIFALVTATGPRAGVSE